MGFKDNFPSKAVLEFHPRQIQNVKNKNKNSSYQDMPGYVQRQFLCLFSLNLHRVEFSRASFHTGAKGGLGRRGAQPALLDKANGRVSFHALLILALCFPVWTQHWSHASHSHWSAILGTSSMCLSSTYSQQPEHLICTSWQMFIQCSCCLERPLIQSIISLAIAHMPISIVLPLQMRNKERNDFVSHCLIVLSWPLKVY